MLCSGCAEEIKGIAGEACPICGAVYVTEKQKEAKAEAKAKADAKHKTEDAKPKKYGKEW